MKIRLLEDNVLIREEEVTQEEMLNESESGLITTPSEEAFESTFRGVVVEKGTEVEDLNTGDRVLFRKPMFDAILVGKESLWIGRKDAVIGVVIYD